MNAKPAASPTSHPSHLNSITQYDSGKSCRLTTLSLEDTAAVNGITHDFPPHSRSRMENEDTRKKKKGLLQMKSGQLGVTTINRQSNYR